MSLETLLEAARYLEYRSEVKARGEEPHDYYTFSKLCAANSGSITNIPASQPSQSQKHHPQTSNNQAHHTEEVKEKRRSGSSTSRDSSLSKEHGGSGTREVHNKLEKNRRAHLKECFEALKKQLPNMDDRKTSNLSILRGALRCIQILKRKEREHEHDLEKLAREKIAFQQQLAALKKELSAQYDHIDVNALISVEDNETTTTASECGAGSDFEDEYHNVSSSSSNHNSRLASDDTSSLSSVSAAGGVPKPVASTVGTTSFQQTSAYTKQTATVNSVFPSAAKGSLVKGSSSLSADLTGPVVAKNLARSASSDGHGVHLVTSGAGNNHSARFIPASSLQTVTGIISPPHAVQVITPPSSIKLLTAGSTVSSSATIQPFAADHQQQQQQQQQQHGQIHVLASSLPYVTTTASKIATPDQLVQVADLSTNSKQQAPSPVALVSSKAFVGVTQIATAAQPVIVNQTSPISELMPSSASSLPSSGLVKTSSSGLGTAVALTMKNSSSGHSGTDANSSNSSHSILSTSLHTAKASQQAQSASSSQTISALVPSEGLQIGSTSRQVGQTVPSSVRAVSSSAGALLTHGSNISQFSSHSPITVPAGHLVGPGNHISGISPFVGSVSVVSHTGALHHHQVLAQSQPIGKVLASPILKSFNQVPIIQQQFLQAPGAVSSQHLVKPVVVVSMPNIIHSSNISPLASRHPVSTNDQPEALLCSSQPGSQK